MPVRASIQGKESLAACRGGIRRQVTCATGWRVPAAGTRALRSRTSI